MEVDPTQLQGVVLLSHPALEGSYFEKCVILIVLHDNVNGALGFVLNRPIPNTLGDYLPTLPDLLGATPVFRGGPVHADQISIMGFDYDSESVSINFSSHLTPEQAQAYLNDTPNAKLWSFLGYAGWEASQLEEEIENGEAVKAGRVQRGLVCF